MTNLDKYRKGICRTKTVLVSARIEKKFYDFIKAKELSIKLIIEETIRELEKEKVKTG